MYQYETNCTIASGHDIVAMMETAKEINYRALVAEVGEAELRKVFPDYNWNGDGGLTLAADYAVMFYRGKYMGRSAYIVQHSAIEYVFTMQ